MKATFLLAQFPVSTSIGRNIEGILTGLDQAREGEIVVFPEGAVSGYSDDLSFLKEIETGKLETALEVLRHQSRERRIHLWVGSYIQDGPQWFNAVFGFTPDGGAYQYRKINLAVHERGAISPGSDLPVFQLQVSGSILTAGVQLCREIRFPEQWAWLASQGAQVILHLNNAVGQARYQPVWRSHLVSHAAANQRYVISVNNAAKEQNCPTMAVSPEGWVLEEILSQDAIFKRVEVELDQVSDRYLSQRRQDVVQLNIPNKKERRRILRALRLNKLQDELEEIQNNPDLYKERNLSTRTEALEFIRLLEDMHAVRPRDRHLENLFQQGIELRHQLERINHKLFSRLRDRMKLGETNAAQLRAIFSQYTDYRAENPGQAHYGYENLDGLVSGLFFTNPKPGETLERRPEMVRYQSTPASVILEMVDQVQFKPQDIFFDLGSGLGLVVGLVHLLTGVRCVGIEYQPSYSAYARQVAMDFGLSLVDFINGDVMKADLSEGTVFYLFNPFGGHIFDAVMANLHDLAGKKQITICSYGPSTEQIAQQTWLKIENPETVHDFKLAIFRSQFQE